MGLTIAGLAFAFWQITKTKRTASAAAAAADEAKTEIHFRLLMSELPLLSHSIASIKDNIARSEFRTAAVRFSEVQSKLFRISGNRAMDSRNRTKIRRTAEQMKQLEALVFQCEASGSKHEMLSEIQQSLSQISSILDVICASELNK